MLASVVDAADNIYSTRPRVFSSIGIETRNSSGRFRTRRDCTKSDEVRPGRQNWMSPFSPTPLAPIVARQDSIHVDARPDILFCNRDYGTTGGTEYMAWGAMTSNGINTNAHLARRLIFARHCRRQTSVRAFVSASPLLRRRAAAPCRIALRVYA